MCPRSPGLAPRSLAGYLLKNSLVVGAEDGPARRNPQHPTALYEMVFLALLWVSLAVIHQTRIRRQSPPRAGALFRQFMVAYLSFRLLVELLKPRQPLVLGLSAIQATCVLALLYYGWLWFRLRRTDAAP